MSQDQQFEAAAPPRRQRAASSVVYIEPFILARPDAAAFLSLSESMLDNLVAEKKLKPPRKISKGRSGWLVSELKEFGSNLPVSDLLPPKGSGHGRAGKLAAT